LTIALAIFLYSAFIEEKEIVCCLLDFQEIKLQLRKIV